MASKTDPIAPAPFASAQQPNPGRTLVPHRPWLLGALVVLALSVLGTIVLARAVDNAYQQRFDFVVDVFESVIEDQVTGYRSIGFLLPSVLDSDDDGLGVDSLTSVVEDAGAGASLVGLMSLDGFAALGFVSIDTSGAPNPVMLPNGHGLDTADLIAPDMVQLAEHALDSGRPAVSAPLEIRGSTTYAYVVPGAEDMVIVEFVDPSALLTAAGIRRDEQVVTAVAFDAETGAEVGSTGSIPDGVRPNQTLTAQLLGRELAIDVYHGPGFDWESGWVPGLSTGGLGLGICILIYVIGVVSRRRSLEHDARMQIARQNLEDKDRFIAAVSHELRTPLTAVVGLADELAVGWEKFQPEEARELTEIVAQEGHDMSLLVEDLLVAARIEQGEVGVDAQVFSVADQVRLVVRALGDRGSHILVGEVDASAVGDPLRVRQIVRNLITNALRHGGDEVRVEAHAAPGTTSLRVYDNGDPVDNEARTRMFEPYYKSSSLGTRQPSVGLGLSVSNHLAQLMHGQLTYRHENGWAVFQLDLPSPT